MRLYEAVSAYLQRKDTIAFGKKPNALVTLVVRKILGSSTFAVAETLGRIIERLKAHQRPDAETLVDFDAVDTTAEEFGEADEGTAQAASGAPIDPNELADEIEELELYCALALKIGSNAKGRELVGALPKALGASRRQQMLRPARPRQGHVRTGREADISGPQGKSEDQPHAKQIAPAEGVTPPG